MKTTLLLFLLLSIVVFSCLPSKNEQETTTYQVKDASRHVDLVVIDSCEYLYGPWGNATVLTHKGNCKNHKK